MSDSTGVDDRRKLQRAIARKSGEIRELGRRRHTAEADLRRLKAKLAAFDDHGSTVESDVPGAKHGVPRTSSEKIALFRSLFRGREDVFPLLWTNRRTGRQGYAPACDNEWVRGVCEKPQVRCGECPNQAFLPVTDRAIRDHLQGRHVAGVYPLLADDTCWFLAVDFDKGDWKGDISAFRDAAGAEGLPVAIERSRSGRGAHAWFFFDSSVPASTARALGCFLITRAMSMRHGIGMDSYDRLFPNQDTLPRGGFGNLIALPLQQEARAHGNSVFVDERFRVFPDQWAYLAAVQRLSSAAVERVAAQARREGQVLGIRPHGIYEVEDQAEPWLLKPANHSMLEPRKPEQPLPGCVRATLAQQLFVEKTGLPSPVLAALKRLASFQNPEFYKRQAARLSTATTPRIVTCAEDLPRHVALPRGCVDDAAKLLESMNSSLEIEDRRHSGQMIEARFRGTPTELQSNAVRALLAHDLSVLVAPPGIGKTVAGILLITERARNALVLVHRQPLLDQWIAQLAMFLDVDPKSIGRIGGGKRKITGWIDVAMFQSMVRRDSAAEEMARYGHIIVDECHHVPARSFERVLSTIRARYVTGLTATPKRRDGHQPIIHMQLGPVRHAVDPRSRIAASPFDHRLIVRETAFEFDGDSDQPIQRIFHALMLDDRRNELILDDIIGSLEAGRSPIVLTERKAHLDFLAERLRGFTKNLIVLRGGMGAKARREALDMLNALGSDEERLVLATGRYIGEGFDDSRLDTLFLTMPVSWRGTLVQYAGRLHRGHPGKTEVRIHDYFDRRVPVLARMYKRRVAGYRSIGYEPNESMD